VVLNCQVLPFAFKVFHTNPAFLFCEKGPIIPVTQTLKRAPSGVVIPRLPITRESVQIPKFESVPCFLTYAECAFLSFIACISPQLVKPWGTICLFFSNGPPFPLFHFGSLPAPALRQDVPTIYPPSPSKPPHSDIKTSR